MKDALWNKLSTVVFEKIELFSISGFTDLIYYLKVSIIRARLMFLLLSLLCISLLVVDLILSLSYFVVSGGRFYFTKGVDKTNKKKTA
jgi:hypothetical protein